MKKLYMTFLIGAALLVLAACGGSTPTDQAQLPAANLPPAYATPTPQPPPPPFILEYPSDMREIGFTEPIVLDRAPDRVAVMSVGSVMVLYELGVGIVAVPQTAVIEYPESLDVPRLPGAMTDDFDIEMVVSLDPELVIAPFVLADTHGATLESLGIPVYYVMAGHVVPFESIRLQTKYFINAFGNEQNSAAGQVMLEAFYELEANFSALHESTAGLSVMVLQGDSHLQTETALLGSMLGMMGFTNVSNMPGSLIMIDFEQALYYEPDWVFAVGSVPTAAEHQVFMEAGFADNQAYWDSISAIYEGRIVYLPVRFISSAGIAIVDIFNELIEIVESVVLGE